MRSKVFITLSFSMFLVNHLQVRPFLGLPGEKPPNKKCLISKPEPLADYVKVDRRSAFYLQIYKSKLRVCKNQALHVNFDSSVPFSYYLLIKVVKR